MLMFTGSLLFLCFISLAYLFFLPDQNLESTGIFREIIFYNSAKFTDYHECFQHQNFSFWKSFTGQSFHQILFSLWAAIPYILIFILVLVLIVLAVSFFTVLWLLIIFLLSIIFLFFALQKIILSMKRKKKDQKLTQIHTIRLHRIRFIILTAIISFCFGVTSQAAPSSDGKFDAGQVIIGHIVDSYEWHIASIGDKHISIYLPVILYYEGNWYIFSSKYFHHGQQSYQGFKIESEGANKGKIVRVLDDGVTTDTNASYILDLSITRNVVGIFIATIVVLIIFLYVAKQYKKHPIRAPRGLQNALEILIIFLRDETIKPAIGEKHYMRFMPFLLTLFFFIFFANLIGLVPFFPGGSNITGNLAVTGTLALFTFVAVLVSGKKDFYNHIFNTPGVPWFMKIPIPLMPVVELLGLLTKPFVLMVRLFANITAGHIVSIGFITLIFIFAQLKPVMGFAISPLSVLFYLFITMLELLVAFIQAYVFTILSALYLGMAVEEHHHEQEHHVAYELSDHH